MRNQPVVDSELYPLILKVVGLVLGLRVSESEEYDGLDLSQHGESGYIFE